MIINNPIKARRVRSSKHWSPEAKDIILKEMDQPGAVAKNVAARYSGLLDGGRALSEQQVKRMLLTRAYVRSSKPKHVWSQKSTDLLVYCILDLKMSAPEVAKKYHLKLDGGQPLTASKVRGLVHRHDPETRKAYHQRQMSSHSDEAASHGNKKVGGERKSGPSSPILRFISSGGLVAPQPRGLPEKPDLPIATEHRLAHLFLVNLGANQCRLVCTTTEDGDAVCCGRECAERPIERRGNKGRFYSYCSEHLAVMQKPSVTPTAARRYENDTARFFSRNA